MLPMSEECEPALDAAGSRSIDTASARELETPVASLVRALELTAEALHSLRQGAEQGRVAPPSLTDAERASHLAHKRESFDGMRAYHMSEIHHKQDAVKFLGGLVASAFATYGGILVLVSGGHMQGWAALVLSVLVGVAIAYLAGSVVSVTNKKFISDNSRYEDFRRDYIAEWKILGIGPLFKKVEPSETSFWEKSAMKDPQEERESRVTSGYSKTTAILLVFRNMVWFAALLGPILVALLAFWHQV